MTKSRAQNASVLGRLLEELSWVGATIRDYRNGGRGFENVLTAEAFQGLDFLPRQAFLGQVLAAARGADKARQQLISEVEVAKLTLLPGNYPLIPSGAHHHKQLPVQPDGLIESPGTFTILEAKRILRSSFQPEQLSREYVLALREAGARAPLLLIVTGTEPPFKVTKHGKLTARDAIGLHLESVLARAENHSFTYEQARESIDDVVCWVTWQQVSAVVQRQSESFSSSDVSLRACVDRLANSVIAAIDWHSRSDG